MKLIKNIQRSEFLKNVLPLVLGSGGGQLVLLLTTPLITRIYDPINFGILTLYAAVLSVLSILINGRYELSIMLPEHDDDSKSLVSLSIFICVCLTSMMALVILVVFYSGAEFGSDWYFFLIPAVLLTGIFQVSSVWNNRRQNYQRIAKANVTQTASTAISQIILGLSGAQLYGLILGALIGLFSGVLVYLKSKVLKLGSISKEISVKSLIRNAKEYKEFPCYSLFGAFINNLALQSPVFFIGVMFQPAFTGQYGLASRIVFIPVVLISTAVFQVIFKKISVLFNEDFRELRNYLSGKFLLLVGISFPFCVIFQFWSKEIFQTIFGAEWAMAGEFAKYLTWVAFIKFSITPLTGVFLLKGNVKIGTYWQTLYFFSLSITMYMLYQLGSTIEFFLAVFLIHELILNLICLYLVWFVCSPNKVPLTDG